MKRTYSHRCRVLGDLIWYIHDGFWWNGCDEEKQIRQAVIAEVSITFTLAGRTRVNYVIDNPSLKAEGWKHRFARVDASIWDTREEALNAAEGEWERQQRRRMVQS